MWNESNPKRQEQRRFALTLAISLLLHALVLCIRLAAPPGAPHPRAGQRESRLDVALTQPVRSQAAPLAPSQARRESRPRVLTARPDIAREPARSWSQAERDEMNSFLDDLAANARPRGGQELRQRALAMAARAAVAEQPDDDQRQMLQKFANARVDRFSVEMYFDALFRKMNHSATMIGKENVTRGRQTAAVKLVLNQDGSVKDFHILWAADQQSEIAFVKAVVDQAAPFPVFPTDIRDATNSIVLLICIQPGGLGSGNATFSRMAQGQGCRG